MIWVLEDEEQFERQTSGRMASLWQRNVSSQGGGWSEASEAGGGEGRRQGAREGVDGRVGLGDRGCGMKQESARSRLKGACVLGL